MCGQPCAFAIPVVPQTRARTRARPELGALLMCADAPKPKDGFFGQLRKRILRPLVTVPGSGARGDLVDCVFCGTTGKNDCTGCNGTGKDPLGSCLMCDGKTKLTCTVCNGVGLVDRIRRGGTDDKGEFLAKK
jgi:hypothetical protein